MQLPNTCLPDCHPTLHAKDLGSALLKPLSETRNLQPNLGQIGLPAFHSSFMHSDRGLQFGQGLFSGRSFGFRTLKFFTTRLLGSAQCVPFHLSRLALGH